MLHKPIRTQSRDKCWGQPTGYPEDLNALNGSKVNGRLLNPHEQVLLQNNDRLEVGLVVFTVRLIQE